MQPKITVTTNFNLKTVKAYRKELKKLVRPEVRGVTQATAKILKKLAPKGPTHPKTPSYQAQRGQYGRIFKSIRAKVQKITPAAKRKGVLVSYRIEARLAYWVNFFVTGAPGRQTSSGASRGSIESTFPEFLEFPIEAVERDLLPRLDKANKRAMKIYENARHEVVRV